MTLNPYLAFNGNCKEAMEFYKDCLGGELMMQTVGESGQTGHMPPGSENNIMHARLTKDGVDILMASDGTGQEVTQGTNISLSINCTSDEEIKSLFEKLSAGGKVTMPLADQFWGATFGMLTDKYGFHWMLNYQKTPLK